MDDSFDKWVRLKEAVNNCRGCSLASDRRLLDNGCRNARIMIVGSIPSSRDLAEAKVFSGKGGDYIRGILEVMDISPENVYMTYLVNCNSQNASFPKSECVEVCIKCLRNQFSLIRPEIVITLGNIPAKKLISKDFKLSRDHGKLISKGKVTFMGTFSPNSFDYYPAYKRYLLSDFAAVKDFCNTYPSYQVN